MKEQIRELVKATLIIGAKRGRTDYPTTEELEPIIEQHIDSMTERFLKLLPQGAVSGSLPLLRETVMRANFAMPENEQDEKWFDEKVDIENDNDFIERIFKVLQLGALGGNDH